MATVALILPALLVPLAGCQGGACPAETFSTGGDPADSPCARVVSAIGYAGLLLEPKGREERQTSRTP